MGSKKKEELDLGDQGDGTYGEINDTSLSISTPKSVPDILRLHMNPRVTIVSLLLIWGFIFWCMFDDEAGFRMEKAQKFITDYFTWLYIGSQDLWALFVLVLYFSKYGKLKLGKDDDEPEYPTLTWFTMLFACGIGIGLIYFGVAEPIYHYTGSSRYQNDPYMPDNTLAQEAMNLTYYHWGIHAWVVYAVIGCLLGVMVFRHGLPMKMSTCFYPLLGDKIFGWVGDFIDGLSIITTLFGVCTSLGLGVIQINTGLNILNSDIEIKDWVQVIIIWVITIIATISTLSGMDIGIRRLSETCFALGSFILVLVFMLGQPQYILNLFVQSIGYYFNYLFQLGFHCDAFEMSSPSRMGLDRNRAIDDSATGLHTWMNAWTIFYWGWWIAWSPFVGIFIAKISKGRTIREFLNGTMTAPILYTFLWMAVFGGSGIRTERLAASEGYCCSQNFKVASGLTTEAASGTALATGGYAAFCLTATCNTCATSILDHAVTLGYTEAQTVTWITSMESETTSTIYSRSDDKHFVRLSCYGSDYMWFFLMESFSDVGGFLDIVSLIVIIFYFVTSSDSGSYIIDTLGSNGEQNPPRLQRLFWALTEGGAATALLLAGGSEGLGALRTVSVVAGMPYTIIICFVCVALWRACQVSLKDLDAKCPDFKIGYLDFATEFKMDIFLEWLLAILLGPYWAAKCAVKSWKMKDFMAYILAAMCYLFLFMFVVFYLFQLLVDNFWGLAWTWYFAFAVIMGAMRTGVRVDKDYNGNAVEDFFAALFLYPSVGQQLKNEDSDTVLVM